MTTIFVLEIQKDALPHSKCLEIKNISKFYNEFDGKVLAIILMSSLTDDHFYSIINDDRITVSVDILNNFAKNRLISNFENDRPELTLTIMGSDSNSKLIKIWGSNVKR
jgi:hypothetical protein